ncbi:MAG: hypothetical protein FWE02_00215 [Defluviitaleaceae bacterium]|nr:hypothetical protein [Defluviitaleaceae bacterium]
MFLLLFSAEAAEAARQGLEVWLINVVPSLFPFMVATNIILKTFVTKSYKMRNKLLKIFNIHNEALLPFIVGFTAGAPLSSKIIADLLKSNKITKTEAQRLLSFCSNMGIIFILGIVSNILNDASLAKIVLLVHYSAALITGFLFRFYKYKEKNIILQTNKDKKTTESISNIFKESITTSAKSILLIGGYIVFFSVAIEVLVVGGAVDYISEIIEYENLEALIYGLVEVTTALEYTDSALIIATILSFSGISIISQSIAFLEKTGINLKVFILGKALHAAIAFLLGFLIF